MTSVIWRPERGWSSRSSLFSLKCLYYWETVDNDGALSDSIVLSSLKIVLTSTHNLKRT